MRLCCIALFVQRSWMPLQTTVRFFTILFFEHLTNFWIFKKFQIFIKIFKRRVNCTVQDSDFEWMPGIQMVIETGKNVLRIKSKIWYFTLHVSKTFTFHPKIIDENKRNPPSLESHFDIKTFIFKSIKRHMLYWWEYADRVIPHRAILFYCQDWH